MRSNKGLNHRNVAWRTYRNFKMSAEDKQWYGRRSRQLCNDLQNKRARRLNYVEVYDYA